MSDSGLNEAARFLTILDELADTFCFRVFDDSPKPDPGKAHKYEGDIARLWGVLKRANEKGCGVFAVVNEGGQDAEQIKRVRAVFADCDTAGKPVKAAFECGLEPHVIVESSPGKWHAYWLVDGLPLEEFKGVQRAIAAALGTDASVVDLPRVMRLPGFAHRKGEPHPVRIIHESGGLPYSADAILAAFPPATAEQAAGAAVPELGAAVEVDRHAAILKETLLLSQDVARGHMTRDEALAVMRGRVAGGRYSREVPDEEIVRALDGAISKLPHVPPAAEVRPNGLADAIRAQLQPISDAELQASKQPHPHAFMRGEMGMFPEREASIVAAPGREGKTTIIVGLLTRYVLGLPVAGMTPQGARRAVILSAEDDRLQYTRKVGAQLEWLEPAAQRQVLDRLLVPDLDAEPVRAYRQLVAMVDRNPTQTHTVAAMIEALAPLVDDPIPLGLVVIETASTWNDAAEDNPGQRAMSLACKRIARELGVAVILVHHTSQAASNNLPTLDVSSNDIRGGTALVDNTRQSWLLVSLGGDDDPFPDNDARTQLRRAVAPGNPARLVALICLDSSKAEDPPPVFMAWERSAGFGPRASHLSAADEFAGKRWRKVHSMLKARRAEQRTEAKQAALDVSVRQVVEIVARMAEEGKQATARAISIAAGRSPAWATPYLSAAVGDGFLICRLEAVPRVKGTCPVYHPCDPSEGDK